ncbi:MULTISPECIES: hypothetical protein [unclassified Mesorhizobium]|uniref:hypothetical protein n=1 Tax=unclassified Mesorhizobium TaxID=325217 RepID=UPI001CCF996F|nr:MULTISPECIES: hypothetical protein [unclassified Mesorhizobium]MBZ9898286.1 hypothetical protein [Mesorhizobium sp. BR1-1-6]MBZ9985214.1 hypothetical protein [Mesorhizobium sp. BR-1-1-8]
MRAELRNAVCRDERRETEAALELALAGSEVIWAEQEALMKRFERQVENPGAGIN